MTPPPREAGKSSFDLIDVDALFGALPLSGARRVLDLGCGSGRYALPLAQRLAPGAEVIGFDLWEDGVSALRHSAEERGLSNVTAEVSDLAHLATVADATADLALLATVVHDLAARGAAERVLCEAARVVRPGGSLAVVEFKKAETGVGPPVKIRLSPEELSALVEPAGFGLPRVVDLGPHAYLNLFSRLAPV